MWKKNDSFFSFDDNFCASSVSLKNLTAVFDDSQIANKNSFTVC